ncbi:MAG: hypothetical protein ABFC57_13195 [Veillonellales bacterium]
MNRTPNHATVIKITSASQLACAPSAKMSILFFTNTSPISVYLLVVDVSDVLLAAAAGASYLGQALFVHLPAAKSFFAPQTKQYVVIKSPPMLSYNLPLMLRNQLA